MKKLSLMLMLCFVSIMGISQIQIQSEGKTQSFSEAKKEASYIRWHDDGYYFRMLDYECSKYHLSGENFIIKIFLGKNAKEVKESGTIIQQWFNDASNDAFINVTNPNGQKICLYKYNANIYASYGNELRCKAVRIQFGADMAAALTGGAYTSKKGRDELMANIEFGDYTLTGMCSFKKEFMKSIQNFKEPGQVSQKVRQEVTEKIIATKKKAKEQGLEESVCMQNYGIIMRELMRSDKETDWETIVHVNAVVTEVTKHNGKINQAELEAKLEEQEDLSEKIAVFEDFYSVL